MMTSIRGTNPTEWLGLSTDDKSSIDIPMNGSTFFEWDTGKIYFYNSDTNSWDLYKV